MNPLISERIAEHLDAISNTMEYLEKNDVLTEMASRCSEALQNGKKILYCGNGGSAADSQHMAAEIVGRFQKERKGLAAVALTTDTSILTAVGNDYGFDAIFSRQVEGIGQTGDVLFAYSTSGNSKNVIEAVKVAKEMGIHTFGFLGKDGGELAKICDLSFTVPHNCTARIQEMHLLAGHIICELVENDY